MSPDQDLILTAELPGNYAAIWTDYDNDGDIDLYITKCLGGAPPGNFSRTNLLYRNNADGTFTEVGTSAGLDDNAQSWSTVFEDFDNDGDFDAFIVNPDFQNRLFRNNGDPAGTGVTFTDVIAASGIDPNDLGAWENASGDFNNDGFVDIFSELNQELYLGNGDLTFTGQDAPVKPGAIADLNGDGFLDVFRKGQLWLNDGNGNHWLKVVPLGIESNRNGIGARVEIYGAWGMQVREVRSGQSFSPMNSLTVHFGLGQNEQVDSLKIRWPSGTVTVLHELAADSTYVVQEAYCLLPPAVLTASGNTSICPGDTIELLAPAGFSNYAWSNNQTGQALQVGNEGRFFAILTDSLGCVALTQSIEINLIEEKIPTIFAPAGNTICQGDTLVLTASSGENYTWSDGTTGAPSIAVTESGSYTVALDALCSQEQIISAPFEVTVLQALAPIVDTVTIGQGDSILFIVLGENCQWYDHPTAGNLLAIGPSFQTPPLDSDTAFYVESHFFYPGEIQQGGKPDTAGAGGVSTQTGFLYFKTWAPFTLLSVTVYVPPGAPLNNRFVQLWSPDTLLAFKQFPVQTGMNVLDLNFEVPVGELTLRCQQGNLFRNSGPLDYPYPIGDVGNNDVLIRGKLLLLFL
ncbi:MAG: CRTAC1 family protein [Saprospiraceae bacterium]|nr:CRTAC1 family protein [Saprospiraceae bacterium]